nr:phosphoenolpyruvate carboxylase [uncultured Carboxylicivirga sp.]
MSDQIEKAFREEVELKYQLYNSLFLTLPLDAVQQTGLLLPLLQDACQKGLAEGLSPATIIKNFFAEHKPGFSEEDQVKFLFKVIQYVERQIVLIDALEEAAYKKIHRIGKHWERIKDKVQRKSLEEQLEKVLESFAIRVVLTAHPTQFYPGKVLAISTDLMEAIKKGDVAYVRDLLQQLGKTAFFRKQKPTAYDEAHALIWYLSNIFYPAIGEIMDNVSKTLADDKQMGKLIAMGFWPGGDRDGNPFVTVDTTIKVAKRLRAAVTGCYYEDFKLLKRRLSFPGIYELMNELDVLFADELSNSSGEKNIDLNYLIARLDEIESILVDQHDGLFLEQLKSFRRKINLFGFYFASIDVRQDSRIIHKAFDALVEKNPGLLPAGFEAMEPQQKLDVLLSLNANVEIEGMEDPVVQDTLRSFGVMKSIQEQNGELGAHRYIISNCRGPLDMARVLAMAKMCGWKNDEVSVDVVPLFETIDDLEGAGTSMTTIYNHPIYKAHLERRGKQQTVMLGFSDGTKDGGYLTANWSIYRAKEDITAVSRNADVEVMFFDGRGGPPARGGGNSHLFYSAMGKKVENKQIQMTVQGQTISSHYGIQQAAVNNLSHLLSAGMENNLFNHKDAELDDQQRTLFEALSSTSFDKYQSLKEHDLFMPFLEERSTLKYYGLANIGSRPSKRGKDTKLNFEDLRAIPFVGAWSQLKLNVPGFYGLGTALKEQLDAGNWEACANLYHSSVFFKALVANSMQSMSKSNFALTQYMSEDPKFGGFWKLIHDEFELTKKLVLKLSGYNEFLEDHARSRMSISLRERIVLPLLTIQQHALMQVDDKRQQGDDNFKDKYEKMVIRSLFGNINASRNSV